MLEDGDVKNGFLLANIDDTQTSLLLWQLCGVHAWARFERESKTPDCCPKLLDPALSWRVYPEYVPEPREEQSVDDKGASSH